MHKKVVKSQENQLVGAGAITLTVLEARDLAAMDANGSTLYTFSPCCREE